MIKSGKNRFFALSIVIAEMESTKRIKIKDLLADKCQVAIGEKVTVKGWVRTKRGNKSVAFLRIEPLNCTVVHFGTSIKN